MNHRVLSPQHIAEALQLKEQKNYSKQKLVTHFYNTYGLEVSQTAIFENIYSSRNIENQKRYLRVLTYKNRPKPVCMPCPSCEKCMTKEIKDRLIPLNFQVEDRCITCYLRKIGLRYLDIL